MALHCFEIILSIPFAYNTKAVPTSEVAVATFRTIDFVGKVTAFRLPVAPPLEWNAKVRSTTGASELLRRASRRSPTRFVVIVQDKATALRTSAIRLSGFFSNKTHVGTFQACTIKKNEVMKISQTIFFMIPQHLRVSAAIKLLKGIKQI